MLLGKILFEQRFPRQERGKKHQAFENRWRDGRVQNMYPENSQALKEGPHTSQLIPLGSCLSIPQMRIRVTSPSPSSWGAAENQIETFQTTDAVQLFVVWFRGLGIARKPGKQVLQHHLNETIRERPLQVNPPRTKSVAFTAGYFDSHLGFRCIFQFIS